MRQCCLSAQFSEGCRLDVWCTPGYAPGLKCTNLGQGTRHHLSVPSLLEKGCCGGTYSSADCWEHRKKTAPRVPRVYISYPGRMPDGRWWHRKNHTNDNHQTAFSFSIDLLYHVQSCVTMNHCEGLTPERRADCVTSPNRLQFIWGFSLIYTQFVTALPDMAPQARQQTPCTGC